jgi:hypothetical protein
MSGGRRWRGTFWDLSRRRVYEEALGRWRRLPCSLPDDAGVARMGSALSEEASSVEYTSFSMLKFTLARRPRKQRHPTKQNYDSATVDFSTLCFILFYLLHVYDTHTPRAPYKIVHVSLLHFLSSRAIVLVVVVRVCPLLRRLVVHVHDHLLPPPPALAHVLAKLL